jgi:hypothetical protein
MKGAPLRCELAFSLSTLGKPPDVAPRGVCCPVYCPRRPFPDPPKARSAG